MALTLLLVGYTLVALLIGWSEWALLRAMGLGKGMGAATYAALVNVVTAFIVPTGLVAAAIAGVLGVVGAINNTSGITADAAFQNVARPIAWSCLAIVFVVRVVPLWLANLRSSFKALVYAIFGGAVICVIFAVIGVPVVFLALSLLGGDPPAPHS